jgi:predicted  nucleic acid-binding Zn-ribbon protein
MSLEKKLYQLFLVDQTLRGLRERLDGAERRLKAQQTKRSRLGQQHSELNDQLKRVQAVASEYELEAASVDERINKLREQMNSAKNNKEYSAFLVEVNTLKADKGKIEETALEEMTKVDTLRGQMAAINADIEKQDQLLELSKKEVTEAHDEISEQLEKLKVERATAVADLPAEAVAEFERLADINDGEAMARIVEEDRRRMEYTCGGCYMGLPVERVSALMRNANVLSYCPSCGRILFLDTELREAFAIK